MKLKKIISAALVLVLLSLIFAGCSVGKAKEDKVVFYSNADDEALKSIENALKANGYEGKYILQSIGTSELGGKLLAEGSNIEADFITMSSYYIDSAQQEKNMFKALDFEVNALAEYPDFEAPTTSQEGAIFVNTEVMKSNNLPMPESIKDLAKPIYKDMISVADINSSSTAWLFIQAIIQAYGTGEEAKQILTDIYKNAGNHIESSGSGPIKKVRAGEVAIGFGLRQQAIVDQKSGLPIQVIDPIEGNYSLIEVVAVVDKGDNTNPLAMEMAKCIIENARPELMQYYPNAVYKGEISNTQIEPKYPKTYGEALTVELLQKHIEFSEACKKAAK